MWNVLGLPVSLLSSKTISVQYDVVTSSLKLLDIQNDVQITQLHVIYRVVKGNKMCLNISNP